MRRGGGRRGDAERVEQSGILGDAIDLDCKVNVPPAVHVPDAAQLDHRLWRQTQGVRMRGWRRHPVRNLEKAGTCGSSTCETQREPLICTPSSASTVGELPSPSSPPTVATPWSISTLSKRSSPLKWTSSPVGRVRSGRCGRSRHPGMAPGLISPAASISAVVSSRRGSSVVHAGPSSGRRRPITCFGDVGRENCGCGVIRAAGQAPPHCPVTRLLQQHPCAAALPPTVVLRGVRVCALSPTVRGERRYHTP